MESGLQANSDQLENHSKLSFDSEQIEYVGGLLSDELMRRLSRLDWQQAHIPIALASLQRIRWLWNILFGHQWLAIRGWGDEGIYQRLRAGLLAQLDHNPQYGKVQQDAREALPDTLPTSDELIVFDDDTRAFYEAGFERLEARLIQLALSEGVDPNTRDVEALFVTHDDHLRHLEVEADKTYDRGLRTYELPPYGPEQVKPKAKPSTTRGRRAVELSYPTAQQIWWEMCDETSSRPTQEEFCDRLSALGHPMSARTLRGRIQKWRESGLAWEPPRPLEEV